MNYAYHLLVYFGIYAIVAMSLNIMVGYCGLLTMAHAAYFGIGCYAYSLATMKFGCDFITAAAIAFLASFILSLALSLPAWRLKGDSFVLVSLAVQQMIVSIFLNWTSANAEPGTWANMTNGSFGLSQIPKPKLFGHELNSIAENAMLALAVCLICGVFLALLLHSPWARLLKGMRDDELALRGLGKNVRLAKLQAIAISCGLAGLAGALYAGYVNYIDPAVASLDESMLVLCMVLVGGIGNFRGPIIGALMLIAIPEILRCLSIADSIASNIRLVIYALLLLIMSHWRPQGLVGSYKLK